MTATLWILGGSLGLFVLATVISLCRVAAKPIPTPHGHGKAEHALDWPRGAAWRTPRGIDIDAA